MPQSEISPENANIAGLREKINTLRSEVESMKSDGISDTEKDIFKKNILKLKNEIQSQVGDDPHELYGELLETIDDVKQSRKDTGAGIEQDVSKLPKKTQDFFHTLVGTYDPVLLSIGQDLQKHLMALSPAQKTILETCTPKMNLISPRVGKIIKETYALRAKKGFGIYIKKSDSGQLAYLVNSDGTPVLSFTVSLGPSTPRYNGSIRNPGDRTYLYEKLGQTFEKQAKRGMIDWGNKKALMTTAILALQTEGSYYLHGTNKEDNLGNNTSQGCVRFDNISIALLSKIYENDPENFHVTIEKT